jgi:hypothetical protein
MGWDRVLELDRERKIISGSEEGLREAIGRGADLRIYTEFRHNEHIDPSSGNSELVKEVSDFRVTYLIDKRWAAGIMNLRMPIVPPEGFGPRPSMSFFLYNENGRQAIARPFLDGKTAEGSRGAYPPDDHSDMPQYHQHDNWDRDTNAPSSNFTYDFGRFAFFVRDEWEEVLSHDENGKPLRGSFDLLTDAFLSGCEIKVGIQGLCTDLGGGGLPHEIFAHTGPGYYNTERRLFSSGSQPVVRVRPGVPLAYTSGGWDFGWLMPRTDGRLSLWICDPYTLRFEKRSARFPIRWFAR